MALNARTGEVEWDVAVGDWTIGQHYSGGPMVIKGRVVAGMSGCYFLNTRCWVSAHDVDTGAEVWRTYTIPSRGEFGYESWGDVPDADRRGGSAWNAPSFDPELNLLFTGVGVPIPWGSVQRGTGDGDPERVAQVPGGRRAGLRLSERAGRHQLAGHRLPPGHERAVRADQQRLHEPDPERVP